MTDLNIMGRILSHLGFEKTQERRRDQPAIYNKPFGDRVLEVQLWTNGCHRASHMRNGRSYDAPTDFSTSMGMIMAIAEEATK